jgi:hypothetical protein
MIRIIGIDGLLFGTMPCEARGQRSLLNLHPLVEYQCCAAISHLQHHAEIPNFALDEVVEFPR